MALVSGSLQFCDGFDTWFSIQEISNANLNRNLKWSGSGVTGTTATGNARTALLTGGRGPGQGQFFLMSVLAGDVLGIFDAKINTTFATGAVTAVSDGAQISMGFNAYFGYTPPAGVVAATGGITASGGYCRVFGFSNQSPGAITGGLQQQRVTFYYNMGTNSFAATLGTGPPPGGTGTPLTPVATGTPTRNPWQQWTYMEMRCYRSTNSGSVDLWIETTGGTMEHVLAVSGLDTSVATRGTIASCFIAAGFFSQTVWFPVAYDDYWQAYLAAQSPDNVLGAPSVIFCLPASAESTQSGATWTASSGANTAAVVAEIPCNTAEYASALISQTGALGNTSTILWTQAAMPYTPASVFAIQATTHVDKITNSGTTAAGKTRIRKGVTDYDGVAVTLTFTSGPLGTTGVVNKVILTSTLELDPDTGAAWVPATANSVIFGPAMSGNTTVTGAGAGAVACFGAYMFMLASVATGTTIPPGGPASGLGQPFWIIQTG